LAVQTARAESVENLRPGTEPGYIAIVRAENETDLSFKVGGILDVIGPGPGHDWEEGSMVKAGTNLANLKQSTFTNALNSARAQADLSTKVRERFLKLRESDAISVQEMEVTEANYLTARAHLAQAEQDLLDSQIRAPTRGAVLARYVNSGATVVAGQRVLRFADISTMSVELGVPDRLVNRFWPGKELDVEISALEGRPPFRGSVSEVGVAASQDSRLFRVVIKVHNPDGDIKSGMTATVRVGEPTRFAPGTVQVPLSALVTTSVLESANGAGSVPFGGSAGSGGSASTRSPDANEQRGRATPESAQLAVFVVKEGKATQRRVKTGDILNSSIIITAGLQDGEEVVTKGASFLYDGAPVEVLQATTNAR
jgi:RND family efflux transporter MFP subunit